MEFIGITDHQHREVKKINQDINTLSPFKENQQNKYYYRKFIEPYSFTDSRFQEILTLIISHY